MEDLHKTFFAGLMEDGAALADALKDARSVFVEAGRPDAVDWIDRELAGYKKGDTVLRYRWLPAVTMATISNDHETIENHVLLPGPQTGDNEKCVVHAAISSLTEIPGLREAIQRGDDFFVSGIHPEQYVLYSRILSGAKPGYRVTRAWHQVSFDEVRTIIPAVRAWLQTLVDGRDRKPSWW